MRTLALFTVAATVTLGACYAPDIANGQYTCSDGRCPDGLVCTNVCRRCVKPGQPLDDGAACAGPMNGCARPGGRSPGDPGLDRLAFCPAAWSMPGLVPPGDRTRTCPGALTADGSGCSAEDNCEPGWHVCDGDADAATSGLTLAACQGARTGLWATRQRGRFVPMVGIECVNGTVDANNVLGCGTPPFNDFPPARDCVVLAASMSSAVCSNSSTAWQCGPLGTNEAETVYKVRLDDGGLLCCHD